MATICQQCCISERADDVLCLFVFVCEFVFACLGQNVTRAGPSSARPSRWSEGRATRCMSIVRLCVILCVVQCACAGTQDWALLAVVGPYARMIWAEWCAKALGRIPFITNRSDARSTRCGRSWPAETLGVSRHHWLLIARQRQSLRVLSGRVAAWTRPAPLWSVEWCKFHPSRTEAAGQEHDCGCDVLSLGVVAPVS